jgi:predicted  nucleic acid-binding Zn-ribbon protein
VKSLLEKTQNERDSLKAKVTEISESLKAARTKIDTLVTGTGQVMNVEDKLTKLAEEKDAALAKAKDAQTLAENLKSRLQEQVKKVAGLEDKNKKLQDMIDELKKSLDNNIEIPSIPKL